MKQTTVQLCAYYTFLTGRILFSVNPLSLLHVTECEKQWSSISLPPKLNHVIATVIRPANKRISWSVALKATDAPLNHTTPNSFIRYTSGKNVSYGPQNTVILFPYASFHHKYITAISGYPLNYTKKSIWWDGVKNSTLKKVMKINCSNRVTKVWKQCIWDTSVSTASVEHVLVKNNDKSIDCRYRSTNS